MNLALPSDALIESGGRALAQFRVWLSDVTRIVNGLTSSGVTGDRPTTRLFVGRTYFDTTLGIPIWYDGTNWINSAGTTV